MDLALELAKAAAYRGEVPIGAVIVRNDQLLVSAFNLRELRQDPIGHAEIIAIQRAARYLNSWRLAECEIYVTLEPCLMCTGAISQARMKRVIFGARDPKAGACGSLYQIHQDKRLNHSFSVTEGVEEQSCRDMLSRFFKGRRGKG